MEQIKIENLSFTYPLSDKKTLDSVNLTVREGEYVVLCGKSGCGKTTLLRHMKTVLTPVGKREGEVLYCGKKLSETGFRKESEEIGFVRQDPENGVVTDKVGSELSFGLENLGADGETIRLRVAETASFFGIDEWFSKDTSNLSGGQLQLLNLASVMVMGPRVIILDEPTAQLDPIAATTFLATVGRINRELGVTVILTEHRLEEVFKYADTVAVMDEGKIVKTGTPREIGEELSDSLSFVKYAMPSAMRIYSEVGSDSRCPVTVREGKSWLRELLGNREVTFKECIKEKTELSKESAVEMKNIFFRYEKDGRDILKNMNLCVPKESVFALLGSNGTGKSTALKIASGLKKPYRGKVKIFGRDIKKIPEAQLYRGEISVLPQNVKTVFCEKTVYDELKIMTSETEKIKTVAETAGLKSDVFSRHPYDLSGGEQQCLALAKILLRDPKILFLDEPTKGMDAEFKIRFAKILKNLCKTGKTVFMVSHDVEFCAKYADMCALLFDGDVTSCASPQKFFSDNNYYTTAANRISRDIFRGAVTDEDVIKLCKRNLY